MSSDDFHKKTGFGSRLSILRTKLNLSQKYLEQDCGLGAGAVSHYEKGSRVPSIENVRRIKEKIGCRWEDLLGE